MRDSQCGSATLTIRHVGTNCGKRHRHERVYVRTWHGISPICCTDSGKSSLRTADNSAKLGPTIDAFEPVDPEGSHSAESVSRIPCIRLRYGWRPQHHRTECRLNRHRRLNACTIIRDWVLTLQRPRTVGLGANTGRISSTPITAAHRALSFSSKSEGGDVVAYLARRTTVC